MRSIFIRALVSVMFSACLCSCTAYDFYVGGRHGWNLTPPESFNHWAERMRFQVLDKLVFKYEKELDSVLEVSEEHYNTCNTTDPYVKLDAGHSKFKFNRSGRFNFISGNYSRCMNDGEKLIVVVMAIRPNKDKAKTPKPHPILPAPPVASPSIAPKIDESPANSPSEEGSRCHQRPQSGSTKLDLVLGMFVGMLAMGLSSGF
ncbi:hypothetical protein LUZ60_009352 [Juncus effusus]|nr:hypothetical protein LUZ60_009352 [Juncus effusus]